MNGDTAVLNKKETIDNFQIVVKSIDWYVPHYIPSKEQQALKTKQNFGRIPAELRHVDRTVPIKNVIFLKLRTFELRSQK